MVTHKADTMKPASEPTRGQWALLRQKLTQFLLQRLWYVRPDETISVRLNASHCIHVMKLAAKPSIDRLEFRELFAQGRRYDVSPRRQGFDMTSTTKQIWSLRRRTSAAAVLMGQFEESSAGMVHIHLRSRMRLFYFLDIFWWPLFITSLIIYMPWGGPMVLLLAIALLSLSWVGHRAHAALEAFEMICFIEMALEAYLPPPPEVLANEGAHLIYEDRAAFAEAWQRFYDAHSDTPE